MLLDFRTWTFKSSLLPNALKVLVEKDFQTLLKAFHTPLIKVDLEVPAHINALFFKKGGVVGVSPLPNIERYYVLIDTVLEHQDVEVIDYTQAVQEEVYFWGADSLVAHHDKEIALCGVNGFSDEFLFEEYCEDFELTPFSFVLDEAYKTSDIAVFVGDVLFLCVEMITDKKIKKQLLKAFKDVGIQVIFISKSQVDTGGMDMVSQNSQLVISQTTHAVLTHEQHQKLEGLGVALKVVDIPFLESMGLKLRDVCL